MHPFPTMMPKPMMKIKMMCLLLLFLMVAGTSLAQDILVTNIAGCEEMTTTHKFVGSCCSLSDTDSGGCQLTVVGGACRPTGPIWYETITNNDDGECPPDDFTISPSARPSSTPSAHPTFRPTSTPSTTPSSSPSTEPSSVPSRAPSIGPSSSPSSVPSTSPSSEPSASPSHSPSSSPSTAPSVRPSVAPSVAPSTSPSQSPSTVPSSKPSSAPSTSPSTGPSSSPSSGPSTSPSSEPSASPSHSPSSSPSTAPSLRPSVMPSVSPSTAPSLSPSSLPSVLPSTLPSEFPSEYPSAGPSSTPSISPSVSPSTSPSLSPSSSPSVFPSKFPSEFPSEYPSAGPSGEPSLTPSSVPSLEPSAEPSVTPSSSPTIFVCYNNTDCSEQFCGIDGNCYDYTCENFFRWNPVTEFDGSGDVELSCEERETSIDIINYGCTRTVGTAGTASVVDDGVGLSSNQRCIGKSREDDEILVTVECYDLADDTDFSNFVVRAEDRDLRCGGGSVNREAATPRYFYGVGYTHAEFQDGRFVSTTVTENGPIRTESFNQTNALKAMFAVVVTEPITPNPTRMPTTPSLAPTPEVIPDDVASSAAAAKPFIITPCWDTCIIMSLVMGWLIS